MVFWGALDISLALIAVHVSHQLSPSFHSAALGGRYSPWFVAVVQAAAAFVVGYAAGLYDRWSLSSRTCVVARCSTAHAGAIAVTTLFFVWVPYVQIGRYILFLTFIQCVLGAALLRFATGSLASRRKGRLLFIGAPAKFEQLRDELLHSYSRFYEAPRQLDLAAFADASKVASVLQSCADGQLDEIVVEENAAVIERILLLAPAIVGRRCVIRAHSAFCEDLLGVVPVDSVDQRGLLGRGWGIGNQTAELISASST